MASYMEILVFYHILYSSRGVSRICHGYACAIRRRPSSENNVEIETSVEDQVRKRKFNNVETETCDRLVLEAATSVHLERCCLLLM